MRVMLFNPAWATMGGGEKYMLTIADVLSSAGYGNVQVLSDRPWPGLEQCRTYFSLPLEHVESISCPPGAVRRVLAGADLAVIQSNFKAYGLPARQTVYMLQVPYGRVTLLTIASAIASGSLREGLKDVLRKQLFRTARHASLALANSAFCAAALRRHHGIQAQVLYPPIDMFDSAEVKRPIILSVGRFFTGAYNDKRYDVMLEAFRRLTSGPGASPEWVYHLAGSCADDSRSQQYLQALQRAAHGLRVQFHLNVSYAELRRLYGEAAVFWHAAGFGVDEDRHPERTEHFGMSTAEAMTAGCVPVVAARGGQKEIVSHGESGYLWNTVDELVGLTAALVSSPSTRERLAEGARRRSRDFSRERFAERCLSLFGSVESIVRG